MNPYIKAFLGFHQINNRIVQPTLIICLKPGRCHQSPLLPARTRHHWLFSFHFSIYFFLFLDLSNEVSYRHSNAYCKVFRDVEHTPRYIMQKKKTDLEICRPVFTVLYEKKNLKLCIIRCALKLKY